MNKSIFLATLFVGLFTFGVQAEVREETGQDSPSKVNTKGTHGEAKTEGLKGLEQAPENSPWDPREHGEPSQDNQAQINE